MLTRFIAARVLPVLMLGGAASAWAHDSWLRLAPSQPGGGLVQLELAVGPRYPAGEFVVAASSVTRSACIEGSGQERTLLPREEQARHLDLRARADSRQGLACWVELRAHDAEMTPDLVTGYFREIRAPEAAQQHWSRQQARAVPWRESYRKTLRIELPAPEGATSVPAVLRQPKGLLFEIVPAGTDVLRARQPAAFQLLLEGRPFAGQWVELVSERDNHSIWSRTDAQGLLREVLPAAGQWLARATLLELPANDAQPWRSRFATLVFHVR